MRRLIVAITLLGLAACGPSLQERTQSMQQYVGKPETVLVQQMGVPDRVFETGGIKFLAYDDRRLGFATPAYGAAAYSGWGWYGYGYAAVPPPQVERICETTFEVTGGTVRSVALRGVCGY